MNDEKGIVNNTNENPSSYENGFSFGAATQIRTGDLILTKDVLYQLSHSSTAYDIISNRFAFVKYFYHFFFSVEKHMRVCYNIRV